MFESFYMPYVLGSWACHHTKDIKTILGDHAVGLENSVFVLIDEANKTNLGHSVLNRCVVSHFIAHLRM